MNKTPVLSRLPLIQKAIEATSYLGYQVRGSNIVGLYDYNVVLEDFFARLLNVVYDLKLENLNNKKKVNFPGIDLGDKVSGICYQVTAERDRSKVEKTIATYIAHNHKNTFPTLRILLIGERRGKYEGIPNAAAVGFDPKTSLVALRDLQLAIRRTTDLPKLLELEKVIDEEMPAFAHLYKNRSQSDKQAIAEYRAYFERRAFQDPWTAEGNYFGFEKALGDLISLLNTGMVDGVPVTKRRSQIANQQWKDATSIVHSKVLALARLYTTYVRSGEIDPTTNRCTFHTPGMDSVFDAFKQDVVDAMNVLLAQAALPAISGVTPLKFQQP